MIVDSSLSMHVKKKKEKKKPMSLEGLFGPRGGVAFEWYELKHTSLGGKDEAAIDERHSFE